MLRPEALLPLDRFFDIIVRDDHGNNVPQLPENPLPKMYNVVVFSVVAQSRQGQLVPQYPHWVVYHPITTIERKIVDVTGVIGLRTVDKPLYIARCTL